jgi:hypothetical protein
MGWIGISTKSRYVGKIFIVKANLPGGRKYGLTVVCVPYTALKTPHMQYEKQRVHTGSYWTENKINNREKYLFVFENFE